MAFSPDGRFLVSAGADMNVKVWDARGWRLIDTKYGHTNVVAGVAFSRDSRRLLTASNDQTVKLWEPAAGREIMTLRGHRHPVWSAAFSPDGWRLASGDGRGTIKIWDGTSSHECISLTDPALDGRRVVISPDGKCLATYGTYSEKVVWEQLWTSLTGKRLTTARRYPVVQVWDVATGRPRLTLRGHTQPVRCAAFAAGTGQLISASGDGSRPGLPLAGELIVWDATTGNELRRRGAADIVAMSCSHDGRRLATVGWDRVVRVWDTARWEETMSLPRLEEPVQDVALSPDGSWLAACSGRGVWVWNAQTGQQVHHLHEPGEQPGGQINELTFSPDSRWIATAESAGPAKIWDVAAGQVIHRLHPRHETGFQSVAFSPDGRRLVTASNGPDAVTIWDLFTRQEILTLARPGDFYDYVAVSPDGRQLAALAFHHENTSTGSAVRHSIRIWDTEPGTVGDVAQREAGSLVQFLFAQCNSRREVLRAIDDQRSISEPVRERARGLVEQYRERP